MKSTLLEKIQSRINHWYIPVVVGILFVILGLYVMLTPIAAYLSLAIIFSWLFIFSGIAEMSFAVTNKQGMHNWGWIFFSGVVDFLLGLLLISNPTVTLEILPIYVGIVLMFKSIRGMSIAMDLKQYGVKNGAGSLMFLCALGIVFSIFMISNVEFGAFTVVYWTAFSLIMFGFFNITIGVKFKSVKDKSANISQDLADRISKIKEEINQAVGDKNF